MAHLLPSRFLSLSASAARFCGVIVERGPPERQVRQGCYAASGKPLRAGAVERLPHQPGDEVHANYLVDWGIRLTCDRAGMVHSLSSHAAAGGLTWDSKADESRSGIGP